MKTYIHDKCKFMHYTDTSYKLHQKQIQNLNNNHYIVYGPKGIGKYTFVLNAIRKYSPSKLQYNKKIILTLNNNVCYNIKVSDIHFELDIDLVGCNAKSNWNMIYNKLLDITNSSIHAIKYVVCKNSHSMHPELIEVFYHYLTNPCVQVKNKLYFVFITETISIFPMNLYNICKEIKLKRPTLSEYSHINPNISIDNKSTTSIQSCEPYAINDHNIHMKLTYQHFLEKIIHIIKSSNNTNKLFELRDTLYNSLIFQQSFDCILFELLFALDIDIHIVDDIISFYKYYDNNYRSIYHLEYIINKICVHYSNRVES